MNLMYEDFPMFISVGEEKIPIITDFREYVRLLDILKDSELATLEKQYLIMQFFIKAPSDFGAAMEALTDFVNMEILKPQVYNEGVEETKKEVYSFKYDYPYIFSAFLRDYGINIRTTPYMHWWEFRLLFDGLSEDNEIKRRIMYRGINLNEVRDSDERKRIEKIQRFIQLPDVALTDYDIGDAFEW